MNWVRTLIADDEPLARDVIRIMLKDVNAEIVGECKNGYETVRSIRELRPDLVFLDVQMPDLDGLEVVKQIGVDNMPVVIFVTAYDQYAIRAFEVHALDYLLKPFDEERFGVAIRRALKQIEQNRSMHVHRKLVKLLASTERPSEEEVEGGDPDDSYLRRIVIKESGRVFFVKTEEIDWIEAAGDYVNLHVGLASHLLHESMCGIEAKLDPALFLRIHRSSIVNADRIRELEPYANGEYFVYLHDGTKLKVSRNYRKSLKKFFGSTL